MNIHEHQAKQILKKYGATVPEGVFALTVDELVVNCLLYTSPSPRDLSTSRMPSSA